jgi:hypothetical protein
METEVRFLIRGNNLDASYCEINTTCNTVCLGTQILLGCEHFHLSSFSLYIRIAGIGGTVV